MSANKLKLDEVCYKGSSTLMQKSLPIGSGEYPVYGASGLIGEVDFYMQENAYIGIVKDGAGVGRAMLLPAKSSCLGTIQYILPKETIDIRFLFYAIENMRLSKYSTGATIPHIYFKDYKNELIPNISLEEQQAVASKFDSIQRSIKRRQAQLALFDDLVKSQFIEMFGSPFSNIKWDTKKLQDISVSLTDGSNIDTEFYNKNDEVLFLRIQNVWRNEFRLEDSVYISSEVNRKFAETSLHTGDLLITKIGRYYTKDSSLGRVALYRGQDDKANYSNNIMRVRLCSSMNSEFVNSLLNLDDYQKFIKRTSKGGTDKRALSKALIGSYPIICPPIELQNEFARFVEQTDKSKFRIKQSLEKLEICYKALLQKYFG